MKRFINWLMEVLRMIQQSFFNTTKEEGETLERYEERAKNQEQIILAVFKKRAGQFTTAEGVQTTVRLDFQVDYPRSSIARALANLTKQGKLIKSEKPTGISSYGRACYVWQYKEDE